ncbi:histidine phosphatase family protein [uncultured Bradyrhizobium sp.]|uniref:SixA phosphatase family protein n=1 Tax=uncultured Bradyrhizobium sp. TaxID=199684 RepID=UPI0035CC5F8D
MRRLMLLRHAKTENDAPTGQDQDRRLDQRGRCDAAEIGGWIAKHPPFPDSVLVSPAVRSHQTWDIAAEAMHGAAPPPKVAFVPELYGADVSTLLQIVHAAAADDPQRLMLIGHNPGLHEFAFTLTGSGNPAGRTALADNLPTSGLVVIDFAIEDWGDVSFRGGQLELFISPKLLKAAPGS